MYLLSSIFSRVFIIAILCVCVDYWFCLFPSFATVIYISSQGVKLEYFCMTSTMMYMY